MSAKAIVVSLAALFVLAAVGIGIVIRLGIYDVGATNQHWEIVYRLLYHGKIWSIRQRAAGIEPPELSATGLIDRGLKHYHQHCVACHGAPGVARSDLGKGMAPVPRNLVQTGRAWTAGEIFWVVKNGIKMTGMPGWDYRMSDDDLWAIVAAVKHLPRMSPNDYRIRIDRLRNFVTAPAAVESSGNGKSQSGDPARGKIAIRQYACSACHMIPGIVGPTVWVGPPISGMATRRYIAGVLTNTPDNMIRWVMDPPSVDPLTTMPNLGVREEHARDIAAYLFTLK